MSAQFLLLLISVIPLLNCGVLAFFQASQKLVNIFSKISPLLFFVSLIGLYNKLNYHKIVDVEIIKIFQDAAFAFKVDWTSLRFLFLLNFIWVIFGFYIHRFLRFLNHQQINNFKLFFAIAVALINFIIIAQNLLTTLFFYDFLILFCHFFAVKFFYKKENKFSHFTFLLYVESVFFFLAVVATYKFSTQINFSANGILSDISLVKSFILLVLYLSGLFLTIIFPSYLFCAKNNFDNLTIYILFLFCYAFVSLYIFIKILVAIFGLDNLSAIISQVKLNYLQAILFLNFLLCAFFIIFNKNLKSLLFYLIFNQIIFALSTIFVFAIFDKTKIYLPLLSFLLSLTLIFLCFSNVILYLEKFPKQNFKGLFYNLKITVSLLIFALLNLIGVVPGISAMEKFFLLKILLKKKLFFATLIFIANTLILTALSGRLIYLFLSKNSQELSAEDKEFAKIIDFDSSLILTSLTTAIVIFLAPVFFLIIK
ncbi:MAG: hypothetical protein SFV53_01820 [Rickettsiales bacterium]|nr:hypothetical protein [Rickettsiales bacterium]